MATATATPRRAIESGVPDNQPFLHPTLKRNYGNWKYHDRPPHPRGDRELTP